MPGNYKTKEQSDAAQKRYMDKLRADPVRWAIHKEKRRRHQKRSIKQINVYQKNRREALRAGFIASRGGCCEDCLTLSRRLIIKSITNLRNHQGYFAFQAISLLSEEKREAILKDCKVLCESCAVKYFVRAEQ